MRSKYRAQPTMLDGIRFDSIGESLRYGMLKLWLRAGAIKDLETHPKWPIEIHGTKVCTVAADFAYTDTKTGARVVEDFKGFDTAMSKLKRKLLAAVHGVSITVVRK